MTFGGCGGGVGWVDEEFVEPVVAVVTVFVSVGFGGGFVCGATDVAVDLGTEGSVDSGGDWDGPFCTVASLDEGCVDLVDCVDVNYGDF